MQKNHTIKPLREFIRAVLVVFNSHWVVKSIVGLIPAVSAIGLAFPPIQNWFIDLNTKELNWLGIVLLVVSVACNIFQCFANMISTHDTEDMTSYIGENQIHHKVAETESAYEKNINEILRTSYHSLAFNENKLDEFIHHYVNPKNRTHHVLNEIRRCIAEECDLASNEIVLSAAVQCDNGKWNWMCPPEFEGCATLEKLVKKDSALKQVIEKQTYYFNNDKKKAISENKYIADRRDVSNGTVGSIICWEVATEIVHEISPENKEVHSFRMIVNISTYGKQLIDPKVANEEKTNWIYEDVIQKMILDRFHGELSENLIWYGLHHLKVMRN